MRRAVATQIDVTCEGVVAKPLMQFAKGGSKTTGATCEWGGDEKHMQLAKGGSKTTYAICEGAVAKPLMEFTKGVGINNTCPTCEGAVTLFC